MAGYVLFNHYVSSFKNLRFMALQLPFSMIWCKENRSPGKYASKGLSLQWHSSVDILKWYSKIQNDIQIFCIHESILTPYNTDIKVFFLLIKPQCLAQCLAISLASSFIHLLDHGCTHCAQSFDMKSNKSGIMTSKTIRKLQYFS